MDRSNLMKKLLDYILEQDKEIDPRGFNLSRQGGFTKAKHELQGLPGVDFDFKVEGDHIWMVVARLEAEKPPGLSEERFKGFISIGDDPNGPAPTANAAALDHWMATALQQKTIEERPAFESEFRESLDRSLAEYIPLWTAWAEGEKPRRSTISLYGDLFAIKRQLESEETAKPHELVWGLGVSSWKLPYPERSGGTIIDFQYPLMTQAVEISIEQRTLSLQIRPRSVEPRFEFDAFSACHISSTAEVEKAAKEALSASADRPANPFDPGSVEHLLKLIAGNIHGNGRFTPDIDAFPPISDDLIISGAWVILARPRPNNYLHEDIERLKAALKSGVDIPPGPLAFVTAPSDNPVAFDPVIFRGLSGGLEPQAGCAVEELYFPLPYNHEQVTIVEQLERASGVAVQGPPGTGKTHTIANIVCHYLALGKKVLVTSKGEKALEVLQAKIPEAVRPLTVALLSGDREGMRQFQTSIEAIIHNVSHLNPPMIRDEIRIDRSDIDRAHAELARIDGRVNEIAYSQLSDLNVDGASLNARKMAELVISGAQKHSWFDDDVTMDTEHAPPLDSSEVSALRQSRRRLGPDLIYASARIPSSSSLLTAADTGKLHAVLVDMRKIEETEANGGLLPLRVTTPDVLADARKLLQEVEAAARLAQELEASGHAWPDELRKKCRMQAYASEREALEALFGEMDGLILARAEFLRRPVEVVEQALGEPKVRQALARAVETGKPFSMFSIAAGGAKAQIMAIRVAGLIPSTIDDWKHVQRYVLLHEKVLSFSVRWNEFAEALSIPKLTGGVAALRNIEQVSIGARKAHLLAVKHDAQMLELGGKVFEKPPIQDLHGTSRQLHEVRNHLRMHLTRSELARAAALLATLREKIGGTSGPVSVALKKFAEEELGDGAYPMDRIIARYTGLVEEVRRIEGLAHDFGNINELAGRIEKAGAPKLGARIRTRPVKPAGEDEVLPASWREAWNWARIKDYLGKIDGREELCALAARRRDLEKGLAKLYGNVVSKSAWLSTKLGASSKVLSALETYRTAVHRIGMGTGPNATRHRRDAQKAMLDAQGAIPCWVMSHAKVSETLPAHLGCFDLVIVDEASQSDLWALPAVLRGRKILVVGDDKQVSPDGGFISSALIQDLRDRFLRGQPYAAVLTPEKSLYDLASTVFAANKVMLREHFRCVPPIIAYSNGTFYNGFIQPLRIPKMSERLDPPLIDVYVEGGTRSINDVNKWESEAIAEEIASILGDSRFSDRSIGVVTLLGTGQAKLIDSEVRKRCDAAELLKRRFDCGDARLFQGSERDIMLLSLVVDPANCKALSGNMFEQRFNVAASRARDRMYLFRSVRLSDLSPSDNLRRGLLGHFSKPADGSIDESESLVERCESGFERQVYSELFSRGYRVVPQVKAGSFRIDLVVEGDRDLRLAIECDGDEFHGPERWAADMSRQRILERAGWTFWRCFASTWSMRKDEVLKDLLDRLAAMGIEPIGAVEHNPSSVEYRPWKKSGADPVGRDSIDVAMEKAVDDTMN